MDDDALLEATGPHLGSFAAEHLSPAYPQRAPWGTAERLRAWQVEALDRYFSLEGPDGVGSGPRDFLAAATPGAGKTTFALRLASELLRRRIIDRIVVVAPTEHLKTQWADAAARVSIRLDPAFSNRHIAPARHYHGVAVTYAQVAVKASVHQRVTEDARTLVILDEVHHGGDALSWGDALREAYGRATRRLLLSGTPVPQRHVPHPVRGVPPRRARHPPLAHRLQLRLRPRARRRGRAARDLPRLRRADALAHAHGRRDGGPARAGQHEGHHRAGVADRARSGGGVDPGGAALGGSTAHRGARAGAGCRGTGHRDRPDRRARVCRDPSRPHRGGAGDRALRRGGGIVAHRDVREEHEAAGWWRCAWSPRASMCRVSRSASTRPRPRRRCSSRRRSAGSCAPAGAARPRASSCRTFRSSWRSRARSSGSAITRSIATAPAMTNGRSMKMRWMPRSARNRHPTP